MSDQLKKRFKDAAIRLVIDLRVISFPHEALDFKRQLMRCSTSTAANYRAACRGKSQADFINKLKIVEEECDETIFWLEVLRETDTLIPNHEVHEKEFNELLSITVRSIRTAKGL